MDTANRRSIVRTSFRSVQGSQRETTGSAPLLRRIALNLWDTPSRRSDRRDSSGMEHTPASGGRHKCVCLRIPGSSCSEGGVQILLRLRIGFFGGIRSSFWTLCLPCSWDYPIPIQSSQSVALPIRIRVSSPERIP